MAFLRQSTSQKLFLGPFLAKMTGGPATALSLTASCIRLGKEGATTMVDASAGATHVENGLYVVTLGTGDVDTLGKLTVVVTPADASALPMRMEYEVVPADVYDAFIKGTDNITVDLTATYDAAKTAAAAGAAMTLTAAYDAAKTAASQTSVDTVDTVVDAIKLKTDNLPTDPADESLIEAAITAVSNKVDTVDGVVDAIKLKTDTIPASPAAIGSAMTLTAAYDAAKTAASQTSVDTVDSVVDAIKLKTDNLPTDPADESLIEAAITAVSGKVDTVDDIVDAIKLKTDLIPASPAAVIALLPLHQMLIGW